ncbi:MAG: hypothetical protein IPK26_10395 [Planctomycetes bacterium]|nr:hypothetical protein [Planctomycetota bacterium]
MPRIPLAPLALLTAGSSAFAQWSAVAPGQPGANDVQSAAAWLPGSRLATVGSTGAFVFDGQLFAPITGPGARLGAAMATDRTRGRIVLFGGHDPVTTQDFADTWEYDGTAWLRRTPATSPTPRRNAVMAYDEWRQRTVLVGGFLGGLGSGDTWEWDGANWTSRVVGLAGVRGGGAATYDAARGYVWMFGGSTSLGGPIRDDLWRYDGNGWLRITGITMPPARTFASMAWDRWSARTLLFGGEAAGGTLLGDTWEWNGLAWTQLQPASAPSPRSGAALVHDDERRQLVLLNGSSAVGAARQVFAWVTDPRPGAGVYGAGCGGLQLRAANDVGPLLGSGFLMNVGSPAGALFGAAGFSNRVTTSGAQLPTPLPAPGCLLWIDPAAAVLLPASPTWTLLLPSTPSLAGLSFYVQTLALGAGGSLAASNGLEARIGVGSVLQQTTAALDAATTDATVSALPASVVVGGDGRHGSFDPTIGTALGGNVFEFDTDHTTIPASLTRSNLPETITDGRFYFAELVIPAGTEVRFRGVAPAQLLVRGRVQIDGVLDISGDALEPFVTGGATPSPTGQPGGRPGAGGGRGGAGGDRCTGFGPTVVNGVTLNHGRVGSDVRLPAGHAYTAQAVGTGGRGALMFPANGLNSSVVFSYFTVFAGNIAGGGGGGGFRGPGSAGSVVPNASVIAGPNTGGGVNFPLPGVLAGTTSLAHYLIGGSGGGGGGSHPYLIVQATPTWPWRSGAAGSGGGGALALRGGRDIVVGNGGLIEARGGAGFRFDSFASGYPSPGGGGSGGSLLLQATGAVQNSGTLDVSGSPGSVSDSAALAWATGVSNGGAGAPGLIRLESLQAGTPGTTLPPITGSDQGPLLDRDARSGLRSTWLAVGAPGANAVLERYELTLLVNGSPVTFSDDPAFGPALADANGAIVARFQSTLADAGNNPDPTRVGPWRTDCGRAGQVDNCNRDVPDFIRIDLTWPANARPIVQSLRLIWH